MTFSTFDVIHYQCAPTLKRIENNFGVDFFLLLCVSTTDQLPIGTVQTNSPENTTWSRSAADFLTSGARRCRTIYAAGPVPLSWSAMHRETQEVWLIWVVALVRWRLDPLGHTVSHRGGSTKMKQKPESGWGHAP